MNKEMFQNILIYMRAENRILLAILQQISKFLIKIYIDLYKFL